MVSVSVASCKKNPQKLAAERLQKSVAGLTFPQELKNGSKLLNLTYSDNVLSFRIEVSQDQIQAINTDSLKSQTINSLKTGLFPRQLMENIINADATVRYVYVCDQDSISIPITAAELK